MAEIWISSTQNTNLVTFGLGVIPVLIVFIYRNVSVETSRSAQSFSFRYSDAINSDN
jgi:hypothetical protein